MNIRSFFSQKKLLLINIFLSIYILTNLIGGDRGLLSYFDKKKLMAVLDIDSNRRNDFNKIDKKNLEKISTLFFEQNQK